MSDKLKGLFGGGSAEPEEDVKKSLADFSQRFVDANGDGIPDDEVRQNFNTVLKTASPETLERATKAAIQNLPEAQRSELAQMLKDRQAGQNLVDIQRTGGTAPGSSAGGGDGDGAGLDDILGGLLGGGAAGGGGLGDILGGLLGGGSASQSGGGGGLGDILGGLLGGGSASQSGGGGGLGDILGGLLGGDTSNNKAADTGGGGGGLGDIISGPLGKMIMGGIAAYATKEMLGK
jgi:hypothetical protein